jgi:hypothetical protein
VFSRANSTIHPGEQGYIVQEFKKALASGSSYEVAVERRDLLGGSIEKMSLCLVEQKGAFSAVYPESAEYSKTSVGFLNH